MYRKSVIVTASFAALLLAGCTFAEVKDGFSNAGAAALDAGGAIVADPALATNPAGLAFVLSLFASGFFSRELGSLAASGLKPGAGLLARLVARFFRADPPAAPKV